MHMLTSSRFIQCFRSSSHSQIFCNCCFQLKKQINKNTVFFYARGYWSQKYFPILALKQSLFTVCPDSCGSKMALFFFKLFRHFVSWKFLKMPPAVRGMGVQELQECPGMGCSRRTAVPSGSAPRCLPREVWLGGNTDTCVRCPGIPCVPQVGSRRTPLGNAPRRKDKGKNSECEITES